MPSRPRDGRHSATYGTLLTWLALGFLTASLVFRASRPGTARSRTCTSSRSPSPGASSRSTSTSSAATTSGSLGLVALPVALALLLYATTIPATAEPLVPALQNNLLLTVHVAVAIVAYGAFTVAFAAALLYLSSPRAAAGACRSPSSSTRSPTGRSSIGFPFLTLTIVLGAVWADVAWGSYWSWDPKETASLVTWLIYGAYLHARVVRGWRGAAGRLLLMLGFAATLFTYFGNLFFGGLHSYSGLN